MENSNTITQHNIENALLTGHNNILEKQATQMPLGEAEDPPETLHTPWGVWLHHWDALHSINQRYDTEHVLRTTRAAEDILFYYHYPAIEQERIDETYEMNFKYDYSREVAVYSSEISLKEESEGFETNKMEAEQNNTEIEDDNPELDKDLWGIKEFDEVPVKQSELNHVNSKNRFNPKIEMQLIKLFERFLIKGS